MELFKCLCGSHNWNLNVENSSDKDYKIFTTPTFDDLFNNKDYCKMTTSKTEDIEISDIRKLLKMIRKPNINYLELLFTKELDIKTCYDSRTTELINELFSLKDKIIKINLPYLYKSCMGIYGNNMNKLRKERDYNPEYFLSYNPKTVYQAFRVLLFLKRFCQNNFTNCEQSIRFDGRDRDYILDIRNNKIPYEQIIIDSCTLYDDMEKIYKRFYINNDFDNKTYDKVEDIIKHMVKINM